MQNMKIRFLSPEEVVKYHQEMIKLYGGEPGIRDIKLLESAINQACIGDASGNFFNKDLFEMASTYLCGIAKNHPFIDGNKRTALYSSVMFLRFNLGDTTINQVEAYAITMGVVLSKVSKEQIAKFFREKYNIC